MISKYTAQQDHSAADRQHSHVDDHAKLTLHGMAQDNMVFVLHYMSISNNGSSACPATSTAFSQHVTTKQKYMAS